MEILIIFPNQILWSPPKKKNKILIIIGIIAVIIIGIIIYTYNVSFLTVGDVKDGVLYGYEYETIGDALEGYFVNCEWESFVADSEESLIDVVEFTGYDAYSQEVVIQFTHDYDNSYLEDGEFEVYGIWTDDGGLTEYEQSHLLDCIYYDLDWSSDNYY